MQAHTFNMTNAGGGTGRAADRHQHPGSGRGRRLATGAGQVAILAGEMNVVGGSIVTTDTTGQAPAGRIAIRAGELSFEGATTFVVARRRKEPNRATPA